MSRDATLAQNTMFKCQVSSVPRAARLLSYRGFSSQAVFPRDLEQEKHAKRFIGTWRLRTGDFSYVHPIAEHKVADDTYTISFRPEVEGKMCFHIKSIFPNGKEVITQYEGVPGSDVPFEPKEVADFMRTTAAPQILKSQAWKDGAILVNALRVLNPDGKSMRVVMDIPAPPDYQYNDPTITVSCTYDKQEEL